MSDDLVSRLRARTVPNWVHSTAGHSRMKGHKPDELCLEAAAEIERLRADHASIVDSYETALHTANELYMDVRSKKDWATAAMYQFHYAMKDAGWHPGRTDDNLCDIIRSKGSELAQLRAIDYTRVQEIAAARGLGYNQLAAALRDYLGVQP